MLFRESKIGGKIGREETPKPKEDPKDIESIRKEIKEKYPEEFKLVEQEIENSRKYTEKEKNKYPELENLKKYAIEAGFKEVLISPMRGTSIEAQPFFNLIRIEESYLPIIKKLKEFAPDFFDKAMKHTLGNIKEEISGHEMEHSKDLALKVYPKTIETAIRKFQIALEKKFGEAIQLDDELKKMKKRDDFYAESQRILKHSKSAKEAVDAIAHLQVFPLLLDSGIEAGLNIKMDKEYYLKSLSEAPDKNEKSIKGSYPYLKKDTLTGVMNRGRKSEMT